MMLHGEEGSENRGVPKYRSRRSPEFMHIFKKRMFATQSMLVSSEPLSMNGLERWQLMPPNSLVGDASDGADEREVLQKGVFGRAEHGAHGGGGGRERRDGRKNVAKIRRGESRAVLRI